jgi:acyl-coenzyme A thioesterase PaaI-like protein
MTDNTAADAAKSAGAFDPRAAGWEEHKDDGFIGYVGPMWMRRDGDRTRFAILTEDKHRNRRGIVQGGLVATLADRAMGLTAWEANGRRPQATIQLDIQYIGAARIGDFIEVDCEVVRLTRSLVFMRSRLTVAGEVVATANGVWKLLDEK